MINTNIDLNLYKTFYAVAKHGGFSKASEVLYVSQPAVSASIKKLEEQLGLKLFKRDNKLFQLTRAGEQLLFYVESMLNTMEIAEKKIKENSMSINNEIKIGVPSHINIFILNDLIEEYLKVNNKMRFTLVNRSTNEMLDMLYKKELDLLVDNDAPILNKIKNCCITRICAIENCFVGAEKYKQFSEQVHTFSELNEQSLLLPATRTLTRNELEKVVRLFDRNLVLKPKIDVSITEVMYDLVIRNIGIGYFPRKFVKKDIQQKKLFEIKTTLPLPKTEICCIYIPETISNCSMSFIKYIENRLSS